MKKRLDSKKVFLVTGGLGFIGSHFIERCLEQGHKVINIDKVTYASNTSLKFKGEYTFINEDISKLTSIPHCDFIINFAAESHVDNSIQHSLNFIESNIKGVYNLLEIIKNNMINSALHAQNYKYPIFIQISTDEVFGDIEQGAFIEDDRHKASNPYSATKSAAEQIVFAWSRTYNIPFLMTRTTNNYGKRQHTEKLIPRAIHSVLNNQKVPIHGTGSYVRNWIHVEDNINAIMCVIDCGTINEIYHIASDEEYSVNEIVQKICRLMKLEFSDVAYYGSDRAGADTRYALNCDKLKLLGWQQKHNLDDSLMEMISYYRTQNDSAI